MIDFKRFIFAYIAITVLFTATSQAMFGVGQGFQGQDEENEMNDLVTGFNNFTVDNTAVPFFTTMQLRGYVTLQLINDTLSQLTISIRLKDTIQILSTTNLKTGTFHNVFIPQDTAFDLIATRDKMPYARPMILTISSGEDVSTRISRWGLARHSASASVPTSNPANLFNVQPDPEHSLLD